MKKDKFKTRWVPVIILILLISVYVFIFHLQNLNPTASPLIQSFIVILSFAVYFFWFQPKLKTWGDRTISFLKMLFIGVPVFFLTIKGHNSYINYQIKNFGVKTFGKIKDDYSNSYSLGRTSYYVRYDFIKDNSIQSSESEVLKRDNYQTGDSIEVIYSSKNPEINFVLSKINTLAN